ncbi:hypothetical protein V8E36_006081 [Tilletia maclaganii]
MQRRAAMNGKSKSKSSSSVGASRSADGNGAHLTSSSSDADANDAPFHLESILEPAIASASTSSTTTTAAVRCAEGYDTNLYVGTSDGNLLWFTLNSEGSSTQNAAYQLQRTQAIVSSGKPVEKLFLLPAISVAVVLCESVVSFWELPSFIPIPPSVLPHIKAVATVVQDDAQCDSAASAGAHPPTDAEGLANLCIIKRKQIILAKLSRERWVQVKDISLPGGASIARRYANLLCVATTSAYSLINLADDSITPLGLPISQTTDSPSAHVRPSILSIVPHNHKAVGVAPPRRPGVGSLAGCEFLITSHSENMTLGVFVRSNGEPAPKLIEWPSHPRALVLDDTFVFALLRNDTIEIHDLTTMDRVGPPHPISPSLEPRFLSASTPSPSVWLGAKNAVHKLSEVPLGQRAERLVCAREWEGLKELADAEWERESRDKIEAGVRRQAANGMSSINQKRHRRDLQRLNQEVGLHLLEDLNFALARRYLSRGRLDLRTLIGIFRDVRAHVMDDEEDESAPVVKAGLTDAPRPWKSVEDLIRANLQQNYSPPLNVDTEPVLNKLSQALLERAKFDLLRGFLIDVRQQRRGEQREGRLGMDELTWRRIGMIVDIVLAKVYASVGDLDELLAIMNEPGNESLEAEVERALRSSRQYGMLAGLLLKKGDQGGAMQTVTELLSRQEDPMVREQINLLLDSHTVQLDPSKTLKDLADDWTFTSQGLQTFLQRKLRESLHVRQEAQIVRALSLAQNLEVGEQVWGSMSRLQQQQQQHQRTQARQRPKGPGNGDARHTNGSVSPRPGAKAAPESPQVEDAGRISDAKEGKDGRLAYGNGSVFSSYPSKEAGSVR